MLHAKVKRLHTCSEHVSPSTVHALHAVSGTRIYTCTCAGTYTPVQAIVRHLCTHTHTHTHTHTVPRDCHTGLSHTNTRARTSHCQLAVFQSLMVPSSEPDASRPSQSVSAFTTSVWSSKDRTTLHVSVFQTFARKSSFGSIRRSFFLGASGVSHQTNKQ